MAIKKKTSSSKPSAARAKPKAKPAAKSAAKPAARAKSSSAKTAAKPKPKAKPKVKLKKSPSGRVLPKTKKTAAKTTGVKKKTAAKKPVVKAEKKPRVPREAPAPAPNPEGLALARRAAELLLDKKAEAVVLIDVRGRTSYTDYLLVASAETERQVSAMAEAVEVGLKAEGNRVISAEGHTPGQWVLLDYGDVVVHLFTQEARPFYDLEGMWPDAPKETLR